MPKDKNETKVSNEYELSYDTKTIITILLLVLVYPIGLIFMFLWMKWPTWVKALIGLPVTLIFIGLVWGAIMIFWRFSNPGFMWQRNHCFENCSQLQNGEEYCYHSCFIR